MKQLIDLVRQLALVAPSRETRRVAEQAAEALFRGVVADSSAVEIEDPEADDTPASQDSVGDDPQG
jgi:hypothetical protein